MSSKKLVPKRNWKNWKNCFLRRSLWKSSFSECLPKVCSETKLEKLEKLEKLLSQEKLARLPSLGKISFSSFSPGFLLLDGRSAYTMRKELNKKADFVSKEGILIGKEDVAWKGSVVRTKRGKEREELSGIWWKSLVEREDLYSKKCLAKTKTNLTRKGGVELSEHSFLFEQIRKISSIQQKVCEKEELSSKRRSCFIEELHENKYFSDSVTVYIKRKAFEEKRKTCI